MKKAAPWFLAAIFAAWFLSGLRPSIPANGVDVAAFGRLPVLMNGRVQPLDSVARNSLLSISGKSTVRLPGAPPLSAIEWLTETMFAPAVADQRPIFRIQHPDLAGLLGADRAGLHTYCFDDLTNQLGSLQSQVDRLLQSERGRGEDAEKTRTPFQRDLMHLYDSLVLYDRLKNSIEPENTDDFSNELALYSQTLSAARTSAESPSGSAKDAQSMERAAAFFRRYAMLSEASEFRAVPPLPAQPRDGWLSVGASLTNSGPIHPAVRYYATMSSAFGSGDSGAFNVAVADYRAWLGGNRLTRELAKAGHEALFSRLEPFYKSMVIYVAALLLGCIYWIRLSETVRRCGMALLLLGFVIHTFGLGWRMYLEGRPPVTNLYSSAIFIGWGAVLLGLILERLFKGAIGIVCASIIGFVTLIIAHHLALSGDTMEMLRAVLDTNLWLSTHVVTVTTGYASMFVAGLLAIIYIVRKFLLGSLPAETGRALSRMVYGIVCFATLFSFVGTILGGIWADQSWGRFWGWDPKENGALLIVLWTAIILHARWAGLIRERGLMVMAVLGNVVTSFSWFGVNMLGIGLHSYGFMDTAFHWLLFFDFTQLAIVALAFIPPLRTLQKMPNV